MDKSSDDSMFWAIAGFEGVETARVFIDKIEDEFALFGLWLSYPQLADEGEAFDAEKVRAKIQAVVKSETE